MRPPKLMLIALLSALFLAAPALPAGADSKMALQNKVEEEMICLCGCGQTVKNCPHENCGFAIPARTKITAFIDEGKSVEEIMQIFLDQYGDEIFA